MKEKKRYIKRKVKVITLRSLFKKYSVGSIEVMRVDTEGYDGIIINQLLDTRVRPKTITYEHLHLEKQELKDLRKRMRQDYRKLYTDKFDDKWRRKKKKYTKKRKRS